MNNQPTLRCLQCFCAAPLPFKRRFWSAAPRESEHARLVLVADDDELTRSLVDEFLVKPIKFPELAAALKRVAPLGVCA